MMEKTETNPADYVSAEYNACCLIVVPPRALTPESLLEALERRKIRIREVVHSATAVAELARGRFDLAILVEPDGMDDADDLIDCIQHYFRETRIWRCVEGQLKPCESPTASHHSRSAYSTVASPPRDTPTHQPHSIVTLSAEELAILRHTKCPTPHHQP